MNHQNQPPQPYHYPHTQPGQGMRHEQLPVYVAPESWGQQPQQEAIRQSTAEHLGNVGMANGFTHNKDGKPGSFNAVSITGNDGNVIKHMKVSRMPGVYDHEGQPVNKFEELSPFEQSVVRAQGPLVKVERAELIAKHDAEMANLPATQPTEPLRKIESQQEREARARANQAKAAQQLAELQAARAAQQQEERERRGEANRQQAAAKMAQLQSQRAPQGARPDNTPKAPEQQARPQPAPVTPPRPPRMGAEQIDTTIDVVSTQTTGVIGGSDVPKRQNPWKDISVPPGVKEAPGTINDVNAIKSSASEPEAEAPAPVFFKAAKVEPRAPLEAPSVGPQAAAKAMGAKPPESKPVNNQEEQRPFIDRAEEEDFSQVSALDALGIDNTAEDFTPQPGRVTKKIHE